MHFRIIDIEFIYFLLLQARRTAPWMDVPRAGSRVRFGA